MVVMAVVVMPVMVSMVMAMVMTVVVTVMMAVIVTVIVTVMVSVVMAVAGLRQRSTARCHDNGDQGQYLQGMDDAIHFRSLCIFAF
jgi:hypothetical protein